ncbi:MAG: hypothetical protein MUP52_03830 [Candidatus Aminicenantes bacterium]|nr:hypothetical protein [Candidatus Aminicenantes bacterium]
MNTQRAASKKNWTSDDTVGDINSGSLQRIADALEKVVIRMDGEKLLHRIAGLKGVVTRMKKQAKKA